MSGNNEKTKIQQLAEKERRAIAAYCGAIIARKWQENPLVMKYLGHLNVKDIFKFKLFFAGMYMH
mgnify:CR=1 FL=1